MNVDAQAPRVVPPSRRRDKPILSCTLCRRRKLKCDRNQPCKTCIDRGLALSCTYVRSNVTQEGRHSKAPTSVHDRIDQLERLVTSLMGNKQEEQTSPAPTAASASHREQRAESDDDGNGTPSTPDRVKLSGDATSYTNSGHWTSILDGISDLREHLDQIPTSASSKDGSQDVPGPDLLFGRQRHASREELFAALPHRSEADQLIATYFASMDAAPTLIHKPTFMREYHNLWARPQEVPIMWLGQLFAIFALGARFQTTFYGHFSTTEDDPNLALWSIRMDFYREKIVQCLILANYTKCPPCTVETLLMYFGTEFLRSTDTLFPVFIIVGMIVRVAFRMGYHRDPSKFPNISPFRAEMRRRTWLLIMSLDLITSAQVGLPRMIQPFMHDTHEPRNLVESDIHEDMVELPPSRPETELTQLLYTIVLTRVRNVHARIMDLMHTTSQPPYRDIMDLDAVLRLVYDRIPESSKAMSSEDIDTVSSSITMRRLYLGLSFLKAELTLHRPYAVVARTDARYEYSRRVCLNAAYEMLSFQRKLDNEIQPGGNLWSSGLQAFTVSWYLSSVVAQDFLLATSVLVADVNEDLDVPMQSVYEQEHYGLRLDRAPPTRDEMIVALQAAYQIWVTASTRSNEARKVAAAVRIVLAKAGADPLGTRDEASVGGGYISQQQDFASPESHFDFTTFADGIPQSQVFAMNDNTYNGALDLGDVPMDLGTFTEAFNWVGMPQEMQMPMPHDSSQAPHM